MVPNGNSVIPSIVKRFLKIIVVHVHISKLCLLSFNFFVMHIEAGLTEQHIYECFR